MEALHRARKPAVSAARVGALMAIGSLVGLAALAAFSSEETTTKARTMAFATVAFAELALNLLADSPIGAAWEAPRNLYLVGSVVLSAAIVIVATYLPA